MAKQDYTASVTFESATGAPETVKVNVVAGGPAPAARRAVELASRLLSGKRWSSMVILLERPGSLDTVERKA
jgi:hypothetical protein